MELPVVLALAAVAALVTLLLCDLAGGIARAKGRSYWAFFAFALLLWFPALITALALPARADAVGTDAVETDAVETAAAPGRAEKAVAAVLLAVGALALLAGAAAAVTYAP